MNKKDIEGKYVKDVYNSIAKQFDQSRYRPWPSVTKFINDLSVGSYVFDAGCGNGRNMNIRNDIKWIGCDSCEKLIGVCKEKGLDVFFSDLRYINSDTNSYDHTLCIAVIHHMFEYVDRVKACQELIRVTKPNGQVLIQVWQDTERNSKKFKRINGSDYMVTWESKDEPDKVYERYYHMFKEEEIDRLINDLHEVVLIKKYLEAENWVIVLKKISL